MRAVRAAAAVAAGAVAAADGYLLVLLGAAAAERRRPAPAAPSPAGRLRFAVLVPAHDEETVIGPTVAALRGLDYPAERFTVVVVADNCEDATAAVARDAGALVWERHDPQRRGKGHALHWALDRVASELGPDAVAMVDADCTASADLLAVMDAGLRAGHDAVQVGYAVARPERAWSVALRAGAFALMNTVRPMGKTRLGLSAGLLGTGMAFRREVLEALPWEAYSIVEDAEYHAQLVQSGRRVVFDGRARVESEMPPSLGGSGDQQMRWEGGRGVTIRRFTLPLLAAGLRRRDPVRLNAAIEWLVPPLSLLGAAHGGLAALAVLLRSRGLARASAALTAALAGFVLGGLALARVPAAVYRALLYAPVLAAQKLLIYARLAAGRTPRSFVRTERG
jgi:glycosyltransferase involved in cell wall biosynthesis